MGEENNSGETSSGGFKKKVEVKSFREIILSAIEKCREELSKEMRMGGQVTQIIEGSPVTLTIPDQRKVAIQTVRVLETLLDYYFDDKVKEELKKLQEEEKSIYPKLKEKYIKQEPREDAKEFFERTGVFHKEANSSLQKAFHKNVEDRKVELHRIKFKELVHLFKRKNELSSVRSLGYK